MQFAVGDLPDLVGVLYLLSHHTGGSMSNDRAPVHDDRWGDHIPWSLRYSTFSQKGDFQKFMTNLATRLHVLFEHNEATLASTSYFLARLRTESLVRFTLSHGGTEANGVYNYFAPETISNEAKDRTSKDPQYEKHKASHINRRDIDAYKKELAIQAEAYSKRYIVHWRDLIAERLEVLQSIFILLLQQGRNPDGLKSLIRDIRRSAAESNVLLDVKGEPPTLVPLEEPLLQKEVLDRLLPRLEVRFPERAADLLRAYHDLLRGEDTNTIFGNAFKALEQVARDLSGATQLQLSDRGALEKAFPRLHGTIRESITKLAAHRGDEGAHGRKGPDEYEIRYLLFCICNVALVLLEYKENCGYTVAELSFPMGLHRFFAYL